jgi:CubicO group peptidase (beta-lactamase class C family)
MTFRFKPGTGFGYSGEAYVRLQRFVEKTTGRSLVALADAAEFTPWHMDRSSYIWRAGFDALAAEGHDANGAVVRTRLWGYDPATSGMRLPPGVEPPPVMAVPNAAASLYTSARDYGRFLERLLAPPPADDVHLGAKWLDTMFAPASRVNDSLGWSLGWGLARAGGTDTFWHWGNNNVYQGFVAGSRERQWGLVVLTNSANGLKLCREIFTRALGAEHPAFKWNLVIPQ